MLTESPSVLTKLVTSLKVAALVTVLGSVVLAVEQRMATAVTPEPTSTTAPSASPVSSADGAAVQAASDYFPAHFAAPSAPVAEQPPTL